MGFREGLEKELGVKADRALAIKLVSRSLSSWLIYRLYCRLGAQRWQALGIVAVGNQLLGIARAIKEGSSSSPPIINEATRGAFDPDEPTFSHNWSAAGKPQSIHTERSEG